MPHFLPPPPQPAVAGVIFAFVCQNYRVHGFREVIGVGDPPPPFLEKINYLASKITKKTPQTPPPTNTIITLSPLPPRPMEKTKNFLILACAATAHLCFILFI